MVLKIHGGFGSEILWCFLESGQILFDFRLFINLIGREVLPQVGVLSRKGSHNFVLSLWAFKVYQRVVTRPLYRIIFFWGVYNFMCKIILAYKNVKFFKFLQNSSCSQFISLSHQITAPNPQEVTTFSCFTRIFKFFDFL